MLVCCDNCKKDFNVKGLTRKTIEKGKYMDFFTCPHCKKKYIAFYSDQELLNMKSKLDRARKENSKDLEDVIKAYKTKFLELNPGKEGVL